MRNLFFSFFYIISISLTNCFSASLIQINELSICNVSTNFAPNKDFKGWIEIYNPTLKSLNLGAYYYSDDRNNPLKYTLKKTRFVNPGGYVLIWDDGEINDQKGTYLNLDSDGGFFSIADASGTILDSISYGLQFPNVSYGRKTDGGPEWGYFMRESCGSSNNSIPTAYEVVEKPSFSLKGGFYNSAQTVEISTNTPGAKIYYSLDSSEPDSTNTLYAGAITINSTTVLRAKAYAAGYLNGISTAATYLINERKPNLPVALLVCDTTYLFNDTIGIYCKGKNGISITAAGDIGNYNQDWTRPGYFEYLDKDHNNVISQMVGLALSGNYSRKYEQKSLEVSASGKYGTKRFDFNFFDNKPNQRFKKLVFRNGGQQEISGYLIKDAFNQTLGSSFNLDYQSYQPCAVYLNGLYWGLMPVREKSSNSYIYSNYNYDDTEYDLIDPTLALAGNELRADSIFNFVQSADMSTDSAYNYVRSKVDVDNFMRYMATQIFLVNTDWPSKENIRFFCPKDKDGRFRWILLDLDKGFSYTTNNMLEKLKTSIINEFYNKLIFNLFLNSKFKNMYIDTQCLVAGAVFNTNRVNAELDRFVAELNGENYYNAEKWNSNWVNNLNNGVAEMKRNTSKFKNKAYTDMKLNLGLSDTLGLNISASEPSTPIFFNGIEMPVLPYDGKYYTGRKLTLTTSAYTNGKKFKHWAITESKSTRYVDSLSVNLAMNLITNVNAVYEVSPVVRRSGLYINEVSANNEIFVDEKFKYEDWIEIYNDSPNPIAMADYYITNDESDLLQFKFSDNADIIPAHGYGIVWATKKLDRGSMHVNFKLEKDEGKLLLVQQSEAGITVIDSMSYSKHTKRTSFGRCPDGSDNLMLFDKSTFKGRNLSSTFNKMIYVQTPVMVTLNETSIHTNNVPLTVSREEDKIVLSKNTESIMQAQLYSITGVQLKMVRFTSPKYSIDMAGLPEGVYLLSMQCENQKQTVKIVK